MPATFIALAIVLWMAIPLALAHLAWWWRGRAAAPTSLRKPEAAP